MFLTKRHLSRRTVLRGAGVTLALPLLDAMIPAATALAQTAARPKLRTGFFYIPHGAIMGNTSHRPGDGPVDAERLGRRLQAEPDPESLEPHKRYVTSFGNLQNQAMVGGVHSLAPATWLSGTKPDKGSGASMSHDARPGGGAAHRPGHDAAVARSGVGNHAAGGRVQQLGVLLQHHALVPRSAFAAAGGVQPAQGLRAAVRGRRHARGARRDLEPDEEPARPHHGIARARCSGTWARAIAWCWTTTWRRCARSNGACSWRRAATCRASRCRRRRSASWTRLASRSTCCSI